MLSMMVFSIIFKDEQVEEFYVMCYNQGWRSYQNLGGGQNIGHICMEKIVLLLLYT